MTKTIQYIGYGYKTFLFVFAAVTLPFIVLKLANIQLKELPFMFIALLGLIKFYLASYQKGAGLQGKLKRKLGNGASKQKLVDTVSAYKTAQDIGLFLNGALILILNIFL